MDLRQNVQVFTVLVWGCHRHAGWKHVTRPLRHALSAATLVNPQTKPNQTKAARGRATVPSMRRMEQRTQAEVMDLTDDTDVNHGVDDSGGAGPTV